MGNFVWTNDYSTGVPDIDAQHKKMLEICEIVNDAVDLNEENKFTALSLLTQYAMEHFDYEENYLREHNPSVLEEQHAEHTAYLKELGKLVHKFELKTGTIKDLKEFTLDWWTNHILTEDFKYKVTK